MSISKIVKNTTLALSFLIAGCATTGTTNHSNTGQAPEMKAGAVVWAGLDYSMVRMIGDDFNSPSSIFPGMLNKWNDLYLKERVGHLTARLNKQVIVDVQGMAARNAQASASQIIPVPGPGDSVESTHITPELIAQAVASYPLRSQSGLGLVFIVDRLVKPSQKGAVYAVYFDIQTRRVLSSTRYIEAAAGAGFRNYWFRVIKNVEGNL